MDLFRKNYRKSEAYEEDIKYLKELEIKGKQLAGNLKQCKDNVN
jgi:hypothetical protein